MLLLKSLPYKTRLLSIYVSTTLVGIALILVAIYNASQEQLLISHLNNVYAVFNDQLTHHNTQDTPTQLAHKLTSQNFKAVPLSEFNQQSFTIDGCDIILDIKQLQHQLTNRGGIMGKAPCLISWIRLTPETSDESLILLHHLQINPMETIFTTYTNRMIIPLVFFIWAMVWGSLILGNLINRLQIQKDEMQHMALHDPLTGLPNRTYFTRKAAEFTRFNSSNNRSFILCMVDLNKFKNVNDELGHHYGDMLLKQVAQRFKHSTRSDDVVARLGGDEFILLLQGTDIDSSMQMLQRIYNSIIQEYSLLDKTVQIGASIGVSYFPKHSESSTELIHKADMAMYAAKECGGGIKRYEASMEPSIEISEKRSK